MIADLDAGDAFADGPDDTAPSWPSTTGKTLPIVAGEGEGVGWQTPVANDPHWVIRRLSRPDSSMERK